MKNKYEKTAFFSIPGTKLYSALLEENRIVDDSACINRLNDLEGAL